MFLQKSSMSVWNIHKILKDKTFTSIEQILMTMILYNRQFFFLYLEWKIKSGEGDRNHMKKHVSISMTYKHYKDKHTHDLCTYMFKN